MNESARITGDAVKRHRNRHKSGFLDPARRRFSAGHARNRPRGAFQTRFYFACSSRLIARKLHNCLTYGESFELKGRQSEVILGVSWVARQTLRPTAGTNTLRHLVRYQSESREFPSNACGISDRVSPRQRQALSWC